MPIYCSNKGNIPSQVVPPVRRGIFLVMRFHSSLGGIDREVNHSSIDIITMICEMMKPFKVPFSIIQEDWADIYMSDNNYRMNRGMIHSIKDFDHLSLFRISTDLSLLITVRSNHGPVIFSYPEQSYLETMCEFIVPVSQIECDPTNMYHTH
jgi:hypothetical protein